MSENLQNIKANKTIGTNELIINIIHWIRYILSKWKVLALFAIIGLTGGVYYYNTHKGNYTAEYSFIVSGGNGPSGGYSGIASQLGLDVGGTSGSLFDENNIITFFRSRSILDKVLYSKYKNSDKLIIDRYIEINGIKDKWSKNNISAIKFNAEESKRTIQEDSVINGIYKIIVKSNLFVDKPDRKSDIIYARFIGNDQVFCKTFIDELMNQVSLFYKETKSNNDLRNVEILQRQVDSVKNTLNASIRGVAVAIDNTPNANPSQQVVRVESQRRVVDAETNKALLAELTKIYR
ncbi:hypothetical protein BWI96_12015 [Siphonobacter sp. SORGH_AS_0500]|uniref:hypothetical protein n=1 Tax=Siphonobacter sp. SORGH_AS_0500 TaxID=1864824 RepID=UPI000CAE12F2|nr:hypothetical protein [Siphonobacter sp. SORGH_AS_0500]PKK36571.1 hypothetical protein BWI96_12015 [Siphonobacter sp. SORGH_AS_0500]